MKNLLLCSFLFLALTSCTRYVYLVPATSSSTRVSSHDDDFYQEVKTSDGIRVFRGSQGKREYETWEANRNGRSVRSSNNYQQQQYVAVSKKQKKQKTVKQPKHGRISIFISGGYNPGLYNRPMNQPIYYRQQQPLRY